MAVAVTPSGKDKLLRNMRFYVGAYDLSGDTRVFGDMENAFDPADITGVSEAVFNFLSAGERLVGIRGYQALINDAANKSHARLKDAPNTEVLSVLFGGGGAPAIGDPAYLLSAIQMQDDRGLDGNVNVLSADFIPYAIDYSAYANNPIGHVLHPATSLTATTTTAGVDDAAQSTKGGVGNIHITVSDAGTWAFKIQDSANDADWADLVAFTVDGTAVTSEQVVIAGTVERYLRIVATRTSGIVTPVVTFARAY